MAVKVCNPRRCCRLCVLTGCYRDGKSRPNNSRKQSITRARPPATHVLARFTPGISSGVSPSQKINLILTTTCHSFHSTFEMHAGQNKHLQRLHWLQFLARNIHWARPPRSNSTANQIPLKSRKFRKRLFRLKKLVGGS